jgi:D-glutamate cyclase
VSGQREDLIGTIAQSVEGLITVDFGYGVIQALNEAAHRRYRRVPALLAAEQLRARVRPGDSVIIATGCTYPGFELVVGEPDGPMGAAALARGLALGLQAKPVIVVEDCLVNGVRAAVRAAELNTISMDHLRRLSPTINRSATVLSFPVDDRHAIEESARLLDDLRPSAIIAIEKLGPNQRGVYHMVKGHDSSAFQAKVGRLFEAARPRGVLTIGVGDRGNEIGMGAIADTVKQVLPYGSKCQCPCGGGVADATEVDVVVPGTCSNWGAYGIAACLAALLDAPEILHDARAETRMLRSCIDAGMADGISLLCEPAVDGIPEEVHLAVVTMLNAVVRTPVARAKSLFSTPRFGAWDSDDLSTRG